MHHDGLAFGNWERAETRGSAAEIGLLHSLRNLLLQCGAAVFPDDCQPIDSKCGFFTMNARHHALQTRRLIFAAFTVRKSGRLHAMSSARVGRSSTMSVAATTRLPHHWAHTCPWMSTFMPAIAAAKFRQRVPSSGSNEAAHARASSIRHIEKLRPAHARAVPTIPATSSDRHGSSSLVLRKLTRGIVAGLARLGQNLSGRRLDLRRPLVHARIARSERSKSSGRQDAILGNGQFLSAHLPGAFSQRQRQAFGARGNIVEMKLRIREQRDAALLLSPGEIQRHGISKGCMTPCQPSGQGHNNAPR
jgi:hypothetical protein